MSRPFSFLLYNNLLKSVSRGSAHASRLSIFLDFDGTLTPIAGHPGDAYLSASTRDILINLNKRYPVAIISGRGLADIKEKVSIPGLTYAGNHGMEMSGGDFSFVYDIGAVESEAISLVAGKVATLTSLYEGAVIEEKGLTLSVHYRLVPNSRKAVFLRRLDRIIRPFLTRDIVKITSGKGLVEIRPTADWDKGSAVAWLMQRRAFVDTLPICVGDDETDEDAFRVVRGSGLSIFVGRRKNEADLYLTKQSEVEAMLAFLVDGRSK